MAKHLPRRDAGDRGSPAKAKMSRWLWGNCEGTFPYFFGRQKTRCAQGELVEKGWMALSQNTLKKIKRLFFPQKDVNAMLNTILVPTANGKPQTASRRLPFAVNAMLKIVRRERDGIITAEDLVQSYILRWRLRGVAVVFPLNLSL